MQKLDIVINPLSGTVSGDEIGMAIAIAEDAGYLIASVVDLTKTGFEVRQDDFKGDGIICLGGDGTLKSVLAAAKTPVIPLPGGTMNMLPNAVLGQGTWDVLLSKALRNPRIFSIPAITINNETFFIAAILGSAAHWAKARESARTGPFIRSYTKVKRALSLINRGWLGYRSEQPLWPNGQWGHAREMILMSGIGRNRLEEDGVECVAVCDHSLRAVMRLSLSAIMAEWETRDGIEVFYARRLRIRATSRIPAILDGEYIRLEKDLNISIACDAAKVWGFEV